MAQTQLECLLTDVDDATRTMLRYRNWDWTGSRLVAVCARRGEPADPTWLAPLRFLQSNDCCCCSPTHILAYWCRDIGALLMITEQLGVV